MIPNGRCRSCGAPIVWVRTMNGKRMPIDAEANLSGGNVWIDHHDAGSPVVAVAASPAEVPPSIPNRYTSHFATCPQAEEWRAKP